MKKSDYFKIIKRVRELLVKANIHVRSGETIKATDFGLGDVDKTGAQWVVVAEMEQLYSREIILLPGQTYPEHKHPSLAGFPNNKHTLRCRYGSVYLYIEGKPDHKPHTNPPLTDKNYYTMFKEVVLHQGNQATINQNKLYWYQAGKHGAVISEYCHWKPGDKDIYTDTRIKANTQIEEDMSFCSLKEMINAGARYVYFVHPIPRKGGNLHGGIMVEGVPGYFETDTPQWGDDYENAVEQAKKLNGALGFTPEEAFDVILGCINMSKEMMQLREQYQTILDPEDNLKII